MNKIQYITLRYIIILLFIYTGNTTFAQTKVWEINQLEEYEVFWYK